MRSQGAVVEEDVAGVARGVDDRPAAAHDSTLLAVSARHARAVLEHRVHAPRRAVPAEFGATVHADRYVAVARLEASEARLERAAVVDDRASDARHLDLLCVAAIEHDVARAGARAQPVERRRVRRDRALHHLDEAVASGVLEVHASVADARDERALPVVLDRHVAAAELNGDERRGRRHVDGEVRVVSASGHHVVWTRLQRGDGERLRGELHRAVRGGGTAGEDRYRALRLRRLHGEPPHGHSAGVVDLDGVAIPRVDVDGAALQYHAHDRRGADVDSLNFRARRGGR